MGLRHVLLGILSREPNTGYGIARALRRSLDQVWDARLQQIYAELARLHDHGLVDVREIALPNRPSKKLYTLTPAGEESLDSWLAERDDGYAPRDDLLVKLYCLDRVPPEVLLRQVSDRAERFAERAAGLRRRAAQVPRTDPSRLGELLTLEAAVTRAEAEVSWCERALALLEEESSETTRERFRAAGA
jgi:DNA-binding PadR family transcriptional regulator